MLFEHTYAPKIDRAVAQFYSCCQIWDTCVLNACRTSRTDHSRVSGPISVFYRGADCCVLVYDVTNANSFKHLIQVP